MKFLTALLLLILLAVVVKQLMFSFRSQSPGSYAGQGPQFVMDKHLSGPILSEGVIFGPNGEMTNSFVATMHGEWSGSSGTLEENFTYSNGKTQQRKWRLQMDSPTTFTAEADDVVGTGKGIVSGSTVRLEYTIVLSDDAGGHKLNVTDWMYLTESGVIMNRSELRKFGLKVAELTANMRPAQPEGQ